MPALLLLTGPVAGKRVELGAEATLGRSPSCEIPLEDESVSRRHAKIEWKDGQARLFDLGSRNGTLLNGQPVQGEAVLLPGDHVQVGDSTLVFDPPPEATLSEEESAGLTTQLADDVLSLPGGMGLLLRTAANLLASQGRAQMLQQVVEEAGTAVQADVAAVMLGSSERLRVAAVAGADTVSVPAGMVRAAMERREAALSEGKLAVPILCNSGAPFGVLWAERTERFDAEAERQLTALGRLLGEAYAALAPWEEDAELSLIGTSAAFRDRLEKTRRAAATPSTVVFHGERGSGRAHLAQFLHIQSPRANGPWVVVDCALGLPRVEEELFGRPTVGETPPAPSALLRASGGTLFLKNLESLPKLTADRLARHFQKRTAPTRGGAEVKVDLRILATSTAALASLQSRGELDLELCRALSGLEIDCPPLRERAEDVPLLFETFAARAGKTFRREPPSLTPDARRLLCEYQWPGNILEVRLLAERLSLLYSNQAVTALQLPPDRQRGHLPPADLTAATVLGGATLAQLVSRLEKDAISEALREAGGKKIRAAEILGISRPTLDKKIDDFGLTVEKVRKSR